MTHPIFTPIEALQHMDTPAGFRQALASLNALGPPWRSHPRALALRGYSLFRLDEDDRARAYLQQALRQATDPYDEALACIRLALQLAHEGDHAQALKLTQRAVALDVPSTLRAHVLLQHGRCLRQDEDPLAIESLAQAARSFEQQGDWRRALWSMYLATEMSITIGHPASTKMHRRVDVCDISDLKTIGELMRLSLLCGDMEVYAAAGSRAVNTLGGDARWYKKILSAPLEVLGESYTRTLQTYAMAVTLPEELLALSMLDDANLTNALTLARLALGAFIDQRRWVEVLEANRVIANLLTNNGRGAQVAPLIKKQLDDLPGFDHRVNAKACFEYSLAHALAGQIERAIEGLMHIEERPWYAPDWHMDLLIELSYAHPIPLPTRLDLLLKAHALAEKSRPATTIVAMICETYTLMGHLDKVKAWCDRALEHPKISSEDRQWITRIKHTAMIDGGHLDQYLDEALPLEEHDAHPIEQHRAMINEALGWYQRGYFERAKETLIQAEGKIQSLGLPEEQINFLCITSLYCMDAGDLEHAQHTLQSAQKLSQSHHCGDIQYAFLSYAQGMYQLYESDHTQARVALLEAESLFEQAHMTRMVRAARTNLINLGKMVEDHVLVERCASLLLKEQHLDAFTRASAQGALGALYDLKNQYQRAAYHHAQAARAYAKYQAVVQEANALHDQATSLTQDEHYAQAQIILQNAMQLLLVNFEAEPDAYQRSLMLEQYHHIATDKLLCELIEGLHQEAFSSITEIKSGQYLKQLHAKTIDAPKHAIEMQRHIGQRLELLRRAELDPQWQVDPDRLCQHMEAGQLAMEFALLPDRDALIIWWFTCDAHDWLWIDWDASHQRALEQAIMLVSAKKSRRGSRASIKHMQRALRALYDVLFGSIDPLMDSFDELILSPGARLGNVPFGALINAEGRMLADRLDAISYLPGLAQLTMGALAHRRPERLCVLRAATAQGLDLKRVATEVQHIADVCRDKNINVHYTNGLESLDRQADIVHFAGHAVFDDTHQGTLVSAAPVHALDFASVTFERHPIVVLSGCETGSYLSAGEELFGFIRALLQARARGLICSSWWLDDDFASLLMQPLYHDLLRGVAPHLALHRALKAIRRTHPQFQHPFYWSGIRYYRA